MRGSEPERLLWAVRTLAVDPADELLEIGCGGGVSVALVCDKLGTGKVVAIDRSATMVARARRRNGEHISSGKAVVRTASLESVDLAGERFDKIFAVNVNLFWVRPAATGLAIVKRLLKPSGALYLFYEPPSAARADDIADRLTTELETNTFASTTLRATTTRGAPLLCVSARPVAG